MKDSYNIGRIITGLRSEYLKMHEDLTNIKNQLNVLYASKNISNQNIIVRILPNNDIGIFSMDRKGRLCGIGHLDISNLLGKKNSEICVYNENLTVSLTIDENVEKSLCSLLELPILNNCIKYESNFNENQTLRMFINSNGVMNGITTNGYFDMAVDYKGFIDEVHSISEYSCNHSMYIEEVLNYNVPTNIFPKTMQDDIDANGINVAVKETCNDRKSDIYCFESAGRKLVRKK